MDNRVPLLMLFLWIYCFNVAQASTGFYVDNENAQSIPLAVSRFSGLIFNRFILGLNEDEKLGLVKRKSCLFISCLYELANQKRDQKFSLIYNRNRVSISSSKILIKLLVSYQLLFMPKSLSIRFRHI